MSTRALSFNVHTEYMAAAAALDAQTAESHGEVLPSVPAAPAPERLAGLNRRVSLHLNMPTQRLRTTAAFPPLAFPPPRWSVRPRPSGRLASGPSPRRSVRPRHRRARGGAYDKRIPEGLAKLQLANHVHGTTSSAALGARGARGARGSEERRLPTLRCRLDPALSRDDGLVPEDLARTTAGEGAFLGGGKGAVVQPRLGRQ